MATKYSRLGCLTVAGLTLAALETASTPPAAAYADRVLRVVAAPDEEFTARPGWEETLRVTLQRVSERMEGDVGLGLRLIRITPWTSESPDYDLSALREEMKRDLPPDADEDVVIGFCGRLTPEQDRRVKRLGQSDTPGRAIMVSESAGQDLALVLRHELGHAFGVPHVGHVASIMNADLRSDRDRFDRSSAAILRNNLNLDFTQRDPFAGVRLDVLESLYEELHQDGNYVADLISTVGESYRARGEADAAQAAYRRAAELDPDLASPHLGLGHLALAGERYSEAVVEYEQAQERQPGIAHLDMNLGLAYAGLGQAANARAAYERAIKADPSDTAALNNLGLLFVDEARHDKAEALFRQALSIDPAYAEAWNNLGMVYARTEQPERAMAALNEALRLEETAIAHRNMAYVLLALGRRAEARSHLEAARNLSAEAADSAR